MDVLYVNLIRSHSNDMIPASRMDQAYDNIKEVVIRTPLMRNYNLSNKYKCTIFLKREDMPVVRSFKFRGPENTMKMMHPDTLATGVTCASSGNPAQGLAFACSALQTHGIIYMPTPTPNKKIPKLKHLGG